MNQHYVPKVYLKHFAEKKGDDFFVEVFDKTKSKYFNTNIKNICAEKDLYTLEEGSPAAKDILTVERIYSQAFEPMYKQAYNLLTNDNITTINNFQRVHILLGIFQLYMRNPRILNLSIAHHRREISNLCKRARFKKIKGITYLDEDFSFSEWEEENIIQYFIEKTTKIFKERHLLGIQELSGAHMYSRFEVYKVDCDLYVVRTKWTKRAFI